MDEGAFGQGANKEAALDLKFDLEKPFPLTADSYDEVVAFNVLEHVFNYRGLLKESRRVLKNGGKLIIGVPFLIQVHPSPHDYWRYTGETLKLILEEAGFKDIQVSTVGSGPFTASVQILNNALTFNWLRVVVGVKMRILDKIASRFRSADKLSAEYPLGYFVTARK